MMPEREEYDGAWIFGLIVFSGIVMIGTGIIGAIGGRIASVRGRRGFLPAVFRPFRTVFPGLGAGFLNLGGKTEGTAKKRGKNGEKTVKNGREMA